MAECSLSVHSADRNETVITWQCEFDSVTLQVVRGGLLIENEGWSNGRLYEVNVEPPRNETMAYGSLEVQEENGEYHVVVQPNAVHGGNPSCE